MLQQPAAMKPLTHLEFAIWAIGSIMQASVAVGMIRKRLFREMPIFFCYTIFHVLQTYVAMLALRRSYATYFYVYWVSELFDALLTLLVLQEIFSSVFRPYESLRWLGAMIFRCTLLGLVGLAVAMSVGAQKAIAYSDRVNALITLQRSTLFVLAGAVLFLFLFSRLFGLTLRNYVFGIALGFGAIACITGAGQALRTHVPIPFDDWCRLAVEYGGTIGISVWVYYIMAPSSSLKIDKSQIDASPLKGWNRALGGMLER